MINKKVLKKLIIYRSTHRGTKEMDMLLGTFVKKNIEKLSNLELVDLEKLLIIDDEVISKWYFKNILDKSIPQSKVSKMFKNFKL